MKSMQFESKDVKSYLSSKVTTIANMDTEIF